MIQTGQCDSLEVAANDPLLARVPLEHEAIVYRYGYPIRIRSNSLTPLDTARKSWNTCECRYDDAPLDIRLFLSKSDSPGCLEIPTVRSRGHLLSIVADHENFASLDLKTGFAAGWLTESTIQNEEYFRENILCAMIDPLLEARNIITMDAAGAVYPR